MRPRLSARLEMVVQLLEPCQVLADVGTDHGLVPVAAAASGVAARAIAADLREAPLRAARRTIDRARLADRVTIARGDGLVALHDRGVDAVVMAGLSGQLIVRVLSDAPRVLDAVEQLVLQPNNDVAVVRAWARTHRWHLRDERMVDVSGRLFVICAFRKGDGSDPAYAMAGWSDAELDGVGPLLLARKDPVAHRWYTAQRDRVRTLIGEGAHALAGELLTWQKACDALASGTAERS